MDGVVILDHSHEVVCEAAAAVRMILEQLDATGAAPPAESTRKKRKTLSQKRREHREREAAAVQETAPEPEPEIETEAATEEATDVMSIEYLKRVSPQLVRDPTRTWYWTLSAVRGHPRYLRAAPRLRAEHDKRIAEMRKHYVGGRSHPQIRATADGATYHVMADGTAILCYTMPEIVDAFDCTGAWHVSGPLVDVARLVATRAAHLATRPRSVEAFLAGSEEAEWLGTRAIPEPITSKPNRAGA